MQSKMKKRLFIENVFPALFISPGASGIQTPYLKIMSREFYHYASTASVFKGEVELPNSADRWPKVLFSKLTR